MRPLLSYLLSFLFRLSYFFALYRLPARAEKNSLWSLPCGRRLNGSVARALTKSTEAIGEKAKDGGIAPSGWKHEKTDTRLGADAKETAPHLREVRDLSAATRRWVWITKKMLTTNAGIKSKRKGQARNAMCVQAQPGFALQEVTCLNAGKKQNAPHIVRCATWERQLAAGVPGAIRTRGLSLRRRTLYPTELRRRINGISYNRCPSYPMIPALSRRKLSSSLLLLFKRPLNCAPRAEKSAGPSNATESISL